MRVFWFVIGVLVVVSGAVIALRAGGGGAGVVIEDRAPRMPAPGADGFRRESPATPVDGSAGSGTGRGAAADRMIEEPWVMKRSGSANHAGHDPEAAARRLKALARPGSLASLDALLGIEGEFDDADGSDGSDRSIPDDATNRLLEILAVASLVGEGTLENPYVVSWELLDTARHSYRPRDGLTTIPPDVEKLDGAIVRIEGFFLAPFSLSSTDQLLLMRYVWDGCCNGVPPTAYSTVEVRLAEPAGRRTLAEARTLSIEGRFGIDPYESRGWLLSLYVLENARIVRSGDQ
jgi:hypothetical protein